MHCQLLRGLPAFKRKLELDLENALYLVLYFFLLSSICNFFCVTLILHFVLLCVRFGCVFLGCLQCAMRPAALVVYLLLYFLAGAHWHIALASCIVAFGLCLLWKLQS